VLQHLELARGEPESRRVRPPPAARAGHSATELAQFTSRLVETAQRSAAGRLLVSALECGDCGVRILARWDAPLTGPGVRMVHLQRLRATPP
jgi:hypothetical protein